METHYSFIPIMIITIILLASTFPSPQLVSASSEKPFQEASTKFIRASCSSTTYPSLCFSSLAKHAAFIQTNRVVLAATALNVTLASARSAAAVASALSKRAGLPPRDAAAMRDCVEELGDSVDELRQSIGAMGELRRLGGGGGGSRFQVAMNDAQTWVSAALTDASTCTDGFEGGSAVNSNGGSVKSAVRGRVVQVAQLTSNALALLNQLASLHA